MKQNEITLQKYCEENNKLYLLDEWLSEKNAPDTPDSIPFGSNKKVWWKCTEGHEWQAMIKSRCVGCGCPVCSNRIVEKGTNDLATTHPGIASEWHPTKNGNQKPTDVFAGSRKKYWWICNRGHEWTAAVRSRTTGTGCPYCNGKKVKKGYNDLPSLFPELAEEWLAEKNYPLKPENVTPYSNKKVWWRCRHGHEWQAVISARTNENSGCPYCSGKTVLKGFNDLETLFPSIAAEWHPTLNGKLTPDMVTAGSHMRVWWKCSDGHEWRAFIFSRTGAKKHGCPYCAGRVKKRETPNAYFASQNY